LVGGAVLLVAAIGASVAFALNVGGNSNPGAASSAPNSVSGKPVAVYDYSFSAPADWEQSGGDPKTRKVQLRPAGSGAGQDVVAVQEQKLSYDATADRNRAVAELRAGYDKGANLADFDPSAKFADKDVVYYRERPAGATIDWYVLFKGGAQVSVGCQYTQAGEQRVRSACEQIVRTMAVTG
jgi:type VII secretion-associated protein (TIGR03931 family)